MRYQKAFLLALLLSFFAAGAMQAQTPAASNKPLTLQEAVAVALEKNPTVQAADAYADAVKQGIVVADRGRL